MMIRFSAYVWMTLLLAGQPVAQQNPRPAASRIRGKFENVDVLAAIRAIIMARQPNLVIASKLQGKISVELNHADAETALKTVVGPLGATVTRDEFGVLCVGKPNAPKGDSGNGKQTVLEFDDVDIHGVAAKIFDSWRVSILVGPRIQCKLKLKLMPHNWQATLRSALPSGVVLIERTGIVRIVRALVPSSKQIFSFDNVDVRKAIESIVDKAGKTVRIDENVSGRLTMNLRNLPWRHALALAVRAVDAKVVRVGKNAYVVRARHSILDGEDLKSKLLRALNEAGGGLFAVSYPGVTLEEFAEDIASLEGIGFRKPVSFDLPEKRMAEQITCCVDVADAQVMFEAIADACDAEFLEEDGELRIVPALIDRKPPPKDPGWLEMVPEDACGAAVFELPVKDALTRILDVALDKEGRSKLDQLILETGAYQSTAALIDALHVCLEPGLGIVLRANVRLAETKDAFPVRSDHKCPQWAFVFQIRTNKFAKVLSAPCKKLIDTINANRAKFGITDAFKLEPGEDQPDPIFEFARPDFPGTGALCFAIVGDRFVVGNVGTLIYYMISAATSGKTAISDEFRAAVRKRDKTRGAVWLNPTRMRALIQTLDRKDNIEILEQGRLVRWIRLAFGN